MSTSLRVGLHRSEVPYPHFALTRGGVTDRLEDDGAGAGAGALRLAVKDNIAVEGLPTTCASRILAGTMIPFPATVVRQLRRYVGAAGLTLTLTGKTNMDEFGMGSHSTTSAYGAVRQAAAGGWDAGHSAGGSSGGSAVAVRTGGADVALGTDTGGSVRLPAAYNAVVGFKPSYGMLSRCGVVPYANSLDTVGLLARDVAPVRQLMGHLYLEHDPEDPTSLSDSVRDRCTRVREYYPRRPGAGVADGQGQDADAAPRQVDDLHGFTFGLPLEYNIEELDARVRDGWSMAARNIQEAGGRVISVSLPTTKQALSAYYVIAPAEAASNLAKYDGTRYGKRHDPQQSDEQDGILYTQTRGAGFNDEVKRRILLGSYTLSSESRNNYFIQAQKVRRLVRRDFDRVFSLANPLYDDGETFDLSDMDDSIELETKLGPAQVDFLLCPTAPTPPPRLEHVGAQTPLDVYMNDVFTVPASLAGLPAISLPMAMPESSDVDGAFPFGGLQIIGQYWDDARLLAVSEAISPLISRR